MIRTVRPEDAKRIAEIYSWYVANTTITYEITLPDEAEMLRRVAPKNPDIYKRRPKKSWLARLLNWN